MFALDISLNILYKVRTLKFMFISSLYNALVKSALDLKIARTLKNKFRLARYTWPLALSQVPRCQWSAVHREEVWLDCYWLYWLSELLGRPYWCQGGVLGVTMMHRWALCDGTRNSDRNRDHRRDQKYIMTRTSFGPGLVPRPGLRPKTGQGLEIR